MINCQNCGKANAEGSNFCRYCGAKFGHPTARLPRQSAPMRQQPTAPQPRPQRQPIPQQPRTPPRPYAWKTDELEIRKAAARETTQINNMQIAPFPGEKRLARPLFDGAGQAMSHGYRCPRCATPTLPYRTRKISSGGWIVFAVLLLFFFPLFWVGFLMKEEVIVCPVCDLRLN